MAAKPPQNATEAEQLIDNALATTMHACHCASTSALSGYSPGALTFGRDMYLNIPLLVDILTLKRL